MFPAIVNKPAIRYTPHDWNLNNLALEKISRDVNAKSVALRQDSLQLRHEAHNRIEWKLQDCNLRFCDRIDDVDHLYKNLERTIRDVEKETEILRDAKFNIERALVEKVPYVEAAKEIVRMRDQRHGIDLTDDQVQENLSCELKLLDEIYCKMGNKSHECWEQLCKLKEIRDILCNDMKDKSYALAQDRRLKLLQPECVDDISYKPRPLDIPPGIVGVQQWLDHSVRNCTKGEEITAAARTLIVNCWKTIRDTNNLLFRQREATQYAFRQRIHETQQARDNLAYQKNNLIDEIERMMKEVQNIERQIRAIRNPLKLNHTRLEDRKWRPRMELVADHVFWGLREEYAQLNKAKEELEEELNNARLILNQLQEHLYRVEDDLTRKEKSLQLDTECLNRHTRPGSNPYQYDVPWSKDTSSAEKVPSFTIMPSSHLESYRVTRSTMTENPAQNERLFID
ncbi:tektin-2 [Centruroides vittatus]|uniref:tektin-2 n=1 Tax=Centruroides vittatus TaxID=120091 RepID=UPI00350FDBA2